MNKPYFCRNFFLIDWRHMHRKNAIEISSICWNVFPWIFSNWIQFFVFWDLVMIKLLDFPYLLNCRSYKVGWILKMTATMDLLWCPVTYLPLRQSEVSKNCFFRTYMQVLKVITKTINHIKLADLSEWPKDPSSY